MKNILIITGSVRTKRAADGVLAQAVQAVEASGAMAQVADLRELNLPMFDSEIAPLADGYAPAHPAVQKLMHDIAAADGVVLLVPEYNGMVSAALKNAFDWAGKAWCETPVATVGYNWYKDTHGGIENIRFLMDRIGATMPASDVHLVFKQDLHDDGTPIDEVLVQEKMQASIQKLLA
ncbi:MAG: NAD(P)H-dependent oxidoreductase [Candidatus Saccharibacteria bacterium]|nr:NAD(P)H-dependent oxidoreductase [Candidatus Saccharibacteria bacterium]